MLSQQGLAGSTSESRLVASSINEYVSLKKISALNLLWLVEELQGITHGVGTGVWGAVKESPGNHKWRGSESGVTARSWQGGSWWEGLKVVGLIKTEKLSGACLSPCWKVSEG